MIKKSFFAVNPEFEPVFDPEFDTWDGVSCS